jgi:hypothetical protein
MVRARGTVSLVFVGYDRALCLQCVARRWVEKIVGARVIPLGVGLATLGL